jgi:uncharacterized membrane protein
MANKNVPFSEALTFGWETFKNNALFLIGLYVAVGVITGVLERADEYAAVDSTYFSFVIGVIAFLVNMLLELGLIAINLKFKDDINPEFVDLFNRLPLVFHYTAASILYAAMVIVGLVFFIVPGIYLGVRFHFYGYFIVEEEAGPIEALQKSSALTEGVRMDLFLLGLMLIGINIVGLICLFVGLLVSLPITGLAMAYVYRALLGSQPGPGGASAAQGA